MASKYIAKYDFKAEESGELPLKKGNVVLITAADLATIEEDWVRVSLPTGESGWVPFKFLESTGAKVSATPATQVPLPSSSSSSSQTSTISSSLYSEQLRNASLPSASSAIRRLSDPRLNQHHLHVLDPKAAATVGITYPIR